MGVKISQNTALVVQIHYPFTSVGQVDSTRINLQLSDGSMREVALAPVLNHSTSMTNGPLVVEANEVKTFHEEFMVTAAATLLSIAPHSHLICTSMKAFCITVLGDTIPLVDIPNWDFHWQGSYNFQQPVKIPAFAKLHGYATYNNTAANPHNPNSPPKEVGVGEATTDEMMLFYFAFTGYQQGDENIIVDTTSHTPHYLDCETHSFVSVTDDPVQVLDFQVFPNPAGDFLTIEKSFNEATKLRLTDYSGRVVMYKTLVFPSEKIDLQNLPQGMYSVSLFLENGQLVGSRRVLVLH